MNKKEFFVSRNEEKEAKKIAIAQTNINTNYDAQSVEYKNFRCAVNKWQKDCREFIYAKYNLKFAGCFRFEVLSGTFKITEFGKILMGKIEESDANDLKQEMAEMEQEFLTNVCKK